MARSTSMDEIFSPPLMIMSFLRSTMWTKFSSSHTAMSPVRNQPSVIDGRGCLGLLEVAVHDVIAADHHLADGLHVARHIVQVQVHHAHFAAQHRPAGHGADG